MVTRLASLIAASWAAGRPVKELEDRALALASVSALGDMHTDASYAALVDLLKWTKKNPDPELESALLEGLRKWNKPFDPLPAPKKTPCLTATAPTATGFPV